MPLLNTTARTHHRAAAAAPQFVGFKTGRGAPVNISAASLSRGSAMLEEESSKAQQLLGAAGELPPQKPQAPGADG